MCFYVDSEKSCFVILIPYEFSSNNILILGFASLLDLKI